jgi:hypothetical protein
MPPPSPPTSQAQDGAVVLLETKTGFEAEAIAAALLGRGIDARTADTATAMVMSGVLVRAKVLVPAHTETLARQVLDEIKAEMTDIDWANMDVGPEDDTPRMHAARRGRRLIATLSILLVPVGLAVLALGAQRKDLTLQAIGGAVVLSALAIAMALLLVAGRKVDPDD